MKAGFDFVVRNVAGELKTDPRPIRVQAYVMKLEAKRKAKKR